MKTEFKDRLAKSKEDDEISWMKGYNQATIDKTFELKKREWRQDYGARRVHKRRSKSNKRSR